MLKLSFAPPSSSSRAGPKCQICQGSPERISSLANRGLIRVDYDIPLLNYDYAEYRAYPLHGSMALTMRGQEIIELLEIQGLEEEREC